jgi:hypothetical protein
MTASWSAEGESQDDDHHDADGHGVLCADLKSGRARALPVLWKRRDLWWAIKGLEPWAH